MITSGVAQRDAFPRAKASGEVASRWPHGQAWALLLGFFLTAFAGGGELLPKPLSKPRAVWATVAVPDAPGVPTDFERQEVASFSLDVPKGWSRSEGPGVLCFGGRMSGIRVRTVALHAPLDSPDALELAASEIARLGGGKPGRLRRVKEVSLPAGNAVLFKFRKDPEQVVGLLASLECSVYVFQQPGRLQVLSVWSPTTSDHRALRRRVAESLQWK